VERPVKLAERFSLAVDSLDLDGRGVGRRDGKVVFVEGGLPGEVVEAEILRSKERFDQARAMRIERESAMRATPACPHFGLHAGACGGCVIQHLEPRAQVALKQRALEDALWHLARVRPETMLRPIAGPFWHYRHRARLASRYVAKKGGALVGFHERASSYVADMRTCAVLPRRVASLLPPLRELVAALSLRERMPQIEVAVSGEGNAQVIVLVFRVLLPPTDADKDLLRAFRGRFGVAIWLQPAGPDSAQPLDDCDAVPLALDLPEFGVRIPFMPTDFTQVNHRVNEVLVRRALRLLDVGPADNVVDFFCGLGNFTLPLARQAARVLGFEGSVALVRRAEQAGRLNVAPNASFAARDLFKWTEADWDATVRQLGRVDGVLIDPPREGALAIVRVLAQSAERPRRMVYVSCNPATLARDAALLVHEGGWRLKAAGVVNMFPHTSHVESIGVLEPPDR
jgi:23S rRNA (uracil1939-C5)-methyltransferase